MKTVLLLALLMAASVSHANTLECDHQGKLLTTTGLTKFAKTFIKGALKNSVKKSHISLEQTPPNDSRIAFALVYVSIPNQEGQLRVNVVTKGTESSPSFEYMGLLLDDDDILGLKDKIVKIEGSLKNCSPL